MPDRERAAERIRAALPLHQVDVGTREHLADCPTCDAFDALESLLAERVPADTDTARLADALTTIRDNALATTGVPDRDKLIGIWQVCERALSRRPAADEIDVQAEKKAFDEWDYKNADVPDE